LEVLWVGRNGITSADISDNNNLVQFLGYENQLESLNGNNTNFTDFFAQNNPNLFCIEVDDPVYSQNNWPDIDPQVEFSEDCDPLGVSDFSNAEIAVYPNSVKDVMLYDLYGREQVSTNQSVIDMGNLTSGIYLLKVLFVDGTILNQKVVRE